MNRFLIAPAAAQDLHEIWDYAAEDNLDAADRLLETLYEQIRALAKTPGMGHQREDLAGSYLILYRVRTGSIEVVAVVHGKRDVPTLMRRREG